MTATLDLLNEFLIKQRLGLVPKKVPVHLQSGRVTEAIRWINPNFENRIKSYSMFLRNFTQSNIIYEDFIKIKKISMQMIKQLDKMQGEDKADIENSISIWEYFVDALSKDKWSSIVFRNRHTNVPEVAIQYGDISTGKTRRMSINLLTTNPKNLRSSNSSDKTTGTGTYAMLFAIKEASKIGASITLSPTLLAVPFYESLGFVGDSLKMELSKDRVQEIAKMIENE